MLTATGVVTDVVVTGNVTATASAGTVTLAGTVTEGESETSVTTAPPAGAASVRKIVPVAEPPPTRLPVFRATKYRDGPGSPGVSVSVAPCVVPSVPEIVAVVFAATALVVTGNDALVAPAGTVTLAGTGTPGGVSGRGTTRPAAGAPGVNSTVPPNPVAPP